MAVVTTVLCQTLQNVHSAPLHSLILCHAHLPASARQLGQSLGIKPVADVPSAFASSFKSRRQQLEMVAGDEDGSQFCAAARLGIL